VYMLFASYSSSCLFPCPFPPHTGATSLFPIGQNLLIPPVLQFCRVKIIKYKKRNMMFLLVWDKDSYEGRFLVLFLGRCVFLLKLVHCTGMNREMLNWLGAQGWSEQDW
jgi:hypothetical protein